jgi:hypothetical protein
LADTFSRINDINLSLQCSNATVFNMWDRVESFIKKLSVLRVIRQNVSTLHDFLMGTEHLKGLGTTGDPVQLCETVITFSVILRCHCYFYIKHVEY